MAVTKEQVFLVQGQLFDVENGSRRTIPEIEQMVVVAANQAAMRRLVEVKAPNFEIIGYATLKNYEDTVAKLRAALKGNDVGWKILVE